jgi:hypothetical protein
MKCGALFIGSIKTQEEINTGNLVLEFLMLVYSIVSFLRLSYRKQL